MSGPGRPAPDLPPSGLAVPIAIPLALAQLRSHWDRAALAGAQPHVTVLYPFLPEPDLTPAVEAELARIAATVRPFDVRFERVRPFHGLVWVEPDPATPFIRLTEAVVARWPEWPPYGGLFDEVIPHLTVVESDTAPLEEVETAVRLNLPFEARATRLELWRQDAAGRWHPHWRFPLGGDP
jgi:2'-5' RNA ligase